MANTCHQPSISLPINSLQNFFTAMMRRLAGTFRGITPNGRLKRFIFHFVTVPGKWIRTARTWVLKLYTDRPYDKLVYT
jgi:hypothetical protein